MKGNVIRWTLLVQNAVPVVALMTAGSGCATQQKKRMAMLEDANRTLTERLNLTRGELESAELDRQQLDRRLQDAIDEVNVLKDALAQKPATEEAPPGWTPVPGGAMIALEGNVLFAPGRVAIRREARKTLDAITSNVQGEYAGKDVLVFGHTDDRPIQKSGWQDNYQLSAERALAVVRYLKDRGVAPGRLVACGCGENRPRVPNSSTGSRATNRRVEIFALDPQVYTGRP